MSDYESIIRTAVAMRALADSRLAQLGATVTQRAEPESCQHPAQYRIARRTFGQSGEHWTCAACGYEHDDPEPGSEEAVDGR